VEPGEVRDQLQRAELLIGVRRFTEAAALAYEVAAERPGDPRPLLTAAHAELGRGETVRAEAAAVAALQCSPDLAYGHRLVAIARLNSGFRATARIDRRRWGRSAMGPARNAVTLDPHDAACYRTLAQAAAMAGQLKEAKTAADQGMWLAPEHPDTWLVRARVARLAGDLPVAEAAALQSLRLDPQNYAANNELGLVLERRGRTAESLSQFARTAAIDPTRPTAPTNFLRYGRTLSYLVILVLLSPLAIVWPLWLVASVGLHRILWTWKPSRRFLEARSHALGCRRSRGRTHWWRRRGTEVPPDAPIKGPYGVSTAILASTVGGIALLFVLPSSIGLVTDPTRFLLPAAVSWVVAVLLTVIIRRRRRRRHEPGNRIHRVGALHSG
jgi:tetratricopeptide (TPR) repeat protein